MNDLLAILAFVVILSIRVSTSRSGFRLVRYGRTDDAGITAVPPSPWPLSDTFSGTSGDTLEEYNPTNWTRHTNGNFTLLISAAGRIYATTGSDRTWYYHNSDPSDADYRVGLDLYFVDLTNRMALGPVARLQTGAETGYYAVYDNTLERLILYKRVGGSQTTLGSWNDAITAPDTRTVVVSANGTTIKALADGTERVSVTDSSITATGKAGVYANTAADTYSVSTGIHGDNFTANNTP